MNIAVRLRERIAKNKEPGTMGGTVEYVLTVLAEEIEKEATGKRRKPGGE